MCICRVSAAAVCYVNSLNTDGAACLYTWQVHSQGSSPSSSLPAFRLSLSYMSVNVLSSLCFFLSSAPADLASICLPCSLSLCLSVCISVVFVCPAQLKHNWQIITLFTIKILNPVSHIHKPDMIFAGYALLEWKGYIFVPYTSCGKIVLHTL